MKVEHQLPLEQDSYPSPPPRKKTATASDENVAKKQVETNPNPTKSWKDVDEEISGLQVSTDLLIGNFASDKLLKHCKDFHHPLPSINDFSIIDKDPSQITREAKEAIHIRRLDPNLN